MRLSSSSCPFALSLAISLFAVGSLTGCGNEADLGAYGLGGADDLTGQVRIRIMAANITSGNNQSYDPGHGTRIFQGIKPDIAVIQEFNYGNDSDADARTWVSQAFGPEFSFYREGGAQIPNGIVSRWPIIESGEWDDTLVSNRDFAWARIDIPGPVDLWAVSLHLLTTSSSNRASEAKALVGFINSKVPADDYLVVGGDFNTSGRSESAISTLNQVVQTGAPYPADRNGNTMTNASRAKPYDWLTVDADLAAYKTPVVIGNSTFTNGLVADTRVYSPISEIAPALSGDSGASNMQHMGIVRDFLVPADTTPVTSVTVTAPNGGEQWQAGSMHNITWAAANATTVALEYSVGGAWMVIATEVDATAGAYTWTVPDVASRTAAKVRVSTTDGTGAVDMSDADFYIVPPPATVRVTAPNGGEQWQSGTAHAITWTATNATTVSIAYAIGTGAWTTIASSVSAASGTYSWTLPSVAASSAAKVRVSTTDGTASDTSDANFYLVPAPVDASITLTSPNGGESWAAGSAHTITWTASNATTVALEYTLNGSTWTTIATDVSATAGSYAWTVPSAASTTAKVRVSTSDNGGATDASDAAFAITQSSTPAKVIINEVLANEPGSNTAGEFVEIVNIGGSAVDLSGWAVWDSTLSRHVFAAGTTLSAGGVIVVFGGASGIPAGVTKAVTASTGTVHLGNSGDSVVLKDASGSTVDSMRYTSAGLDGVSMNRNPDATAGASFVAHTSVGTASSSPGTRANGAAF